MITINTTISKAIRQRLQKEYSAICPLTPHPDSFYAVTKHVYFNNRLRTSAGRAIKEKHRQDYWYIELNPKYYQAYGLERVVGTYRHELAHVGTWLFYGELGHSNNFKRICAQFGGTMNPNQARQSHTAHVTNKYLEATPKWRYICPGCGQTFTRVRRIPVKRMKQSCCVKCQTPAKKFSLHQLW